MPRLAAISLALSALFALSLPPQPSAQSACVPHSVGVPILQVLRNPAIPDDFISVLQEGDMACVLVEAVVGPQQMAYVVEKTDPDGHVVPVGGWASLKFLEEAAVSVAGANSGTAEPQVKSPPAPPPPPDGAGETEVLRFDMPVPLGPPEVRGKTLEALADGVPLFPPIEGLPEELWQKPCATCHQWSRERLCDQGQSYIPRAAAVFRHQHPYGGVYKLSLMRWAKTGCL